MMKRIFLFLVFCLFLLTACASCPTAKATLKIIDQDGHPAKNVLVQMGFSGGPCIRDYTDENGMFVGEGRTYDSYVVVVAPITNGIRNFQYYRTEFEKHIANWKNVPEDGKWKPWNETIHLVVKEKVNPIVMYGCCISDFKRNIPKIEEWVGYDFEQNDWVAPYGKGKIADVEFFLKCDWYVETQVKQLLKMRFPYPKAGAYVMEKEMSSDLKSVHHADSKHEYQNEISFCREDSKRKDALLNKKLNTLTKEEYLIFRTRTKVDKDGNLVEARYGKIYGPIEFNGVELNGNKYLKKMVRMSYYLNPNVNDTNLECKPGKSLCPGKEKLYQP
jgi:hypothetical protein